MYRPVSDILVYWFLPIVDEKCEEINMRRREKNKMALLKEVEGLKKPERRKKLKKQTKIS